MDYINSFRQLLNISILGSLKLQTSVINHLIIINPSPAEPQTVQTQ